MNASKLLVIATLLMFAIPAALAQSATTVIDGVVYSGSDINSPPVQGVQVDVTCNGHALSDDTDAAGKWRVIFSNNDCALGSEATACVGSACQQSQVISSVTKFNLLEIKLFDVPEFGTVAATAGLVGLSVGYFFIRKQRK